MLNRYLDLWFQHTAARRRLVERNQTVFTHELFQHTAARRRLVEFVQFDKFDVGGFNTQPPEGGWIFGTIAKIILNRVSTHSRPKAAGWKSFLSRDEKKSFNTQPPEGGWFRLDNPCRFLRRFNTQPPEGGWRKC